MWAGMPRMGADIGVDDVVSSKHEEVFGKDVFVLGLGESGG